MPPIRLNRRRFLGCSAAAGWALSQGRPAGADDVDGSPRPIRLGLIGAGNRGTTLLRSALELPAVAVAAVADTEPRHARRATGIAEKATGAKPDSYNDPRELLAREDLDGVLIALPCDLHAPWAIEALRAGKHVYLEKPLAPSLADCDAIAVESGRRPFQAVHVGFQRRSNPRVAEGVELVRSGELGEPLQGRASWTSSNVPPAGQGGWLARRDRSGDWMIEQAVHVWDLYGWIAGGPPCRAFGSGHRDLFRADDPGRDVTDVYAATIEWPGGLHLTFEQSWVDPADDAFTGVALRLVAEGGGIDFASGVVTYRDRSRPRRALHPGPIADTRAAIEAFAAACRAAEPPLPPISLAEARDATIAGLLVRRAVDERRVVTIDEIRAEPA